MSRLKVDYTNYYRLEPFEMMHFFLYKICVMQPIKLPSRIVVKSYDVMNPDFIGLDVETLQTFIVRGHSFKFFRLIILWCMPQFKLEKSPFFTHTHMHTHMQKAA